MNHDDVRMIYIQNLQKHDMQLAFVLSYKEVAEAILADTLDGEVIESHKIRMVMKVIDALSKIFHFSEVSEGPLPIQNNLLFRNLFFLYGIWQEGLEYLMIHHEELPESIKSQNQKEGLQKALDSINKDLRHKMDEASAFGVVTITKSDFDNMSSDFWKLIKIILEDRFPKFHVSAHDHLSLLLHLNNQATSVTSAWSN